LYLGEKFFGLAENQCINNGDVKVWKDLYSLLKSDIQNSLNNMNNNDTDLKSKLLKQVSLSKCPIAAALFGRRYFLDNVCIIN